MKKLIIASALLVIFSNNLFAQKYMPVESGSAIRFKVSHQMIFKSTVTGTFSGLKGSITFDPDKLSQAFFDVSVAAETISSGIGMRDNDLKKDKYFDVAKYPLITIKSQSITKGMHDDTYIFTGTLTLKGTTRNISFPFTAKVVKGGYQLNGSFDLNRLEYNVGPDNSIDKMVEVDLSVLAK